ncbi:MAG TPA: hypothetical protein VGN13_06145 [Solirubrobacteraceae bacterium]|jgi:hypothetical protein
MRRSNHRRRIALSALALALLVLALPAGTQALLTKAGRPRVSTGAVTHVHGGSGQLEGTVNPSGLPTTYYFQYGPTVAYGSVTPAVTLPAGVTAVRVGQLVNGLLVGYHYRLVASNSAGAAHGSDRLFSTQLIANKLELPKEPRVAVYGSSIAITGHLSGTANAGRKVVLQSSPFPYLAPFATISAPVTTNALGTFSLRATDLLLGAEMRVSTLDVLPLYSGLIHVHVAVKVTFHARPSGTAGLIRLYGTVTPALRGVKVDFQLAKAVRPGRSERETAFATQFAVKVKHATHSFSRFSTIVRLRHSGNYRALVKPPEGALVTGSSAHLKLHAPAAAKGKKG